MRFLTDMHTHSYPASGDAKCSLKEMLFHAQKKGVAFYGVSDHVDLDPDILQSTKGVRTPVYRVDEEEYFHEARHLQEDYEGAMNVAVGVEFGYSDKAEVQGMYASICEKYRPDYVINSVHGGAGRAFCFVAADEKEEDVYGSYLRGIRKSLDAAYPYDIVGHIGYITRYVPYSKKEISLEKYGEQMDDILKTIIAKDKILEVNTAVKDLPIDYLPDEKILRRYFELGGRNISYGSDAHTVERIVEGREKVVDTLKEIGFTHLTVPFRGEYSKVEL